MRKTFQLLALASAAVCTAAAPALAEEKQAEQTAHYSVETTKIGTLLDDPAAAAILKRIIPTVYANDMFQTMGRPNTLRTAAQYESELTAEKMAQIQEELNKLPAKK